MKALEDGGSSRASESGRESWTVSVTGCVDGDRYGENGIDYNLRSGGRKDSVSACFERRSLSSLKCGSEWPCTARRPRESSHIQSWFNQQRDGEDSFAGKGSRGKQGPAYIYL